MELLFAGMGQDYTLVDWTIEAQFILSQSGTQYNKRINPIIITAKSVEYSASSKGSYQLLNLGMCFYKINQDSVNQLTGMIIKDARA